MTDEVFPSQVFFPMAGERCYRRKPFASDEERLEYLFKLYEQMIDEEKSKGTLFETEKNVRTAD